MKTTEIIESATSQIKSHLGYALKPAVVATAVEEGLREGDEFPIGNGITATIKGGEWIATKDSKEVGRKPVADLNETQVSALLKAKAVSANWSACQ